jgi:hypothetical protein
LAYPKLTLPSAKAARARMPASAVAVPLFFTQNPPPLGLAQACVRSPENRTRHPGRVQLSGLNPAELNITR